MRRCAICEADFDEEAPSTLYGEAGEWLSGEMWQDAGELCLTCLENRARLTMMYCPEMFD